MRRREDREERNESTRPSTRGSSSPRCLLGARAAPLGLRVRPPWEPSREGHHRDVHVLARPAARARAAACDSEALPRSSETSKSSERLSSVSAVTASWRPFRARGEVEGGAGRGRGFRWAARATGERWRRRRAAVARGEGLAFASGSARRWRWFGGDAGASAGTPPGGVRLRCFPRP